MSHTPVGVAAILGAATIFSGCGNQPQPSVAQPIDNRKTGELERLIGAVACDGVVGNGPWGHGLPPAI